MKTLPVGIPIDDAVTQPLYLLRLFFPSGTVRYSSREQVTISGQLYVESGFSITQLITDPRGGQRVEIAAPSHDGALRTLLLTNGDWRGERAELAVVYGPQGTVWTDADKVVLFDGVMSGAPEITNYVRISMIREHHETQFSPRFFVGPPDFNHIPPAGATITWGDETGNLDKSKK